ncbi:heavy metal-associated domain-containing protein [Neisseria leonii]|uniref:Heavy-metal-associated domain-containing protein n=1 Tax=Neisseria leonii TaxID=2995413 RepID=A0A9X4IB61_9NEIS|nr:heavy metal-associated domain-containing protein [Neisseria sp. 51.81]MDD9328074.1 heavy-metal-associated domain-containing protein [Neisseria sp. 51.81]
MMQTIILTVHGMTCSGCSAAVARVLTDIAGVRHAGVDLARHLATVEFNPAAVSPQMLIEAVEAAGFDAAVQ